MRRKPPINDPGPTSPFREAALQELVRVERSRVQVPKAKRRDAPSPMYAQTVASQQHRAFYKAGGTDVLAGLRHFDTAKKPCLTARASR